MAPPAQGAADPPIFFQNGRNFLCLQPDPADFWSPGAAIVQMPCNGTAAQGWNPLPESNGRYRFQSVATAMCLDAGGGAVNGTPIQQWHCNWISNEKWTVVGAAPGEGDLIRSAVSGTSSHCMDVIGQSYAAGVAMELRRCDRLRMQGWFRVK